MIVQDRIYGKQEINDQVIIDLINTKAMQRLKGVNQYATFKWLNPDFNTTRYEHCLGVYFLSLIHI